MDISLKMAGDFELWAKFFRHAELYSIQIPLGGFRKHNDQKTVCAMQKYYDEASAVLSRHGGRPYGKFENAFRRFLNRTIGRRQINQLPLPFKMLNFYNIFYPVKRCVWSRTGWQITDGYIV